MVGKLHCITILSATRHKGHSATNSSSSSIVSKAGMYMQWNRFQSIWERGLGKCWCWWRLGTFHSLDICTRLYFWCYWYFKRNFNFVFIVFCVQPFPCHFLTLKCASSLKCYISPNFWWILLNIGLHTLLYVPLMSDR